MTLCTGRVRFRLGRFDTPGGSRPRTARVSAANADPNKWNHTGALIQVLQCLTHVHDIDILYGTRIDTMTLL